MPSPSQRARFPLPPHLTALALSLLLSAPALAQTAALPASPEVTSLLQDLALPLNAQNTAKLLAMDQKSLNPDGRLDLAELDLSGDGIVSRKELQYILSWSAEQLAGEGKARLRTRPRLLPNRTLTGMVQLQVNNPEQVRDPGLLFDSARVTNATALHLGQGDQRSFELYAYLNYSVLRGTLAKRSGSDGQPMSQAWYAIRVHNPGNRPLSLKLAGSGMVNLPNPLHVLYMMSHLPTALSLSERQAALGRIDHATRSNDADLQNRSFDPERQALRHSLSLAPGRSLLVLLPLPLNGPQDFRGQLYVEPEHDSERPLQVQAAVLTELPGGRTSVVPWGEVLEDLDPASFGPSLQRELSTWVEPRADGSTEFLKPASQLGSPAAVAAELRRQQLPVLTRIGEDLRALVLALDGRLSSPQTTPSASPSSADGYLPDTLASATPVPASSLPPSPTSSASPGAVPLTTPTLPPPASLTPAQELERLKKALPAGLQPRAAEIQTLAARLASSGGSGSALIDPWLAPAEIEAFIRRGEALATDLEAAPAIDQALLKRLRAWNAELKMIPRVVGQPEQILGAPIAAELKTLLKAFENRFWTTLLALGRVNGVLAGDLIESRLPEAGLVAGEGPREWNYLLVSNPFTSGGAPPEADPADATASHDSLPILHQSANQSAPPPYAYGHYGLRYSISGAFVNEASAPRYLNLSFGSPDEMGHLDWRSLFDHSDSLMGESSTRFTGSLRLRRIHPDRPAERFELTIVHGRVQAPQTLLSRALRLDPGTRAELELELGVPTNSTAPQVIQFRLAPSGEE